LEKAPKLATVELTPVVTSTCPSDRRFVEIIDAPDGLRAEEINHIQGCESCQRRVLRATKP
jgi:hypothetical protein